MNTIDTLLLASAKIKMRKLRTAITIITASVLFGVIITVQFVASGFFGGMADAARTNLGGPILIAGHPIPHYNNPDTQAKAIELYNKSTDPNKEHPIFTPEPIIDPDGNVIDNPPYLVDGNPFALSAIEQHVTRESQKAKAKIAELAQTHQGEIISSLQSYEIKNGTIFINKLTSNDDASVGADIAIIDPNALAPLIKIKEQKDDVIQVLAPLDKAAKLIDIKRPHWGMSNSTEILRDFVSTVNNQAIGHKFTATITISETQTTEVTFEIIGIIPPMSTWGSTITTINDTSLFPLDKIVLDMQNSYGTQYFSSFLAINPNSTALNTIYKSNIHHASAADIIVAFDDASSAAKFKSDANATCIHLDSSAHCDSISVSELASSQLQIREAEEKASTDTNIFTIIFTIIAVIIMAGTVSRVITDERQTSALYRAVGASTKNILQVFCAYIMMLCLLIIVCSTIIGLSLSGIITAISTGSTTANVSTLLNVPNLAPIIFIAPNLNIFFIYLSILAMGIFCIILVIEKLTSKNIIKDLRKA